MRTIGKLFIILTALLALAVAFAWKHFTKPAPAAQASTVITAPSGSRAPAQHFSTGTSTRSAAESLPAFAVDKAQAFQSLKQRAKAGDAVAQRLLAQTYEACFMINIDRQRFVAGYQQTRMREPGKAATMDRLAQQRIELCDAVDDGAIIPTELIKGWYAQAAANGDLAARAMDYALQRTQLDPPTATRFLEDVVTSGDPAAMYSLGRGLGGNVTKNVGEPYKELVSGPLAAEAWMLAACRMGYDCGPDSADVASFCLMVGRCLGETTEEMTFAMVKTDAERQALERKIQQILDAVSP